MPSRGSSRYTARRLRPSDSGEANWSLEQITKPLLSIGSEAFKHWRESYDKVESICKESKQNIALSWMMTVRGPTHISQTDFAVLFPKWMDLFIKTLIHPEKDIFLKIILTWGQTSSYDTNA